MKLCIWGCGIRTKGFIDSGYIDINMISFFIDNNERIIQSGFFNKPVLRPVDALPVIDQVDCVLITMKNVDVLREIHAQIKHMHFPSEKVLYLYNIHPVQDVIKIQEQQDECLYEVSPYLYQESIYARTPPPHRLSIDFCDTHRVIGRNLMTEDADYMSDYIRFRSFELIAKDINARGISGNVAELGVYKGLFSRLINYHFKDRKLYMFDTFQSFNTNEYEKENDLGRLSDGFFEKFTDTSVEIAMHNMPYPDQCIIRQGFFPDSLQDTDYSQSFVFVSIDVDLEESSFQGLQFFYPRLVNGGVIMLHDYNDGLLYHSIHAAVSRFETLAGPLKKVPLCDESGTLIIVK